MVDVWSPTDGGCLVPCFSMRLYDLEVGMVVRLLRRLNGWRVRSDEEDKLIKEGVKTEAFSVISLY